jgi:hypothetical protein
MSSSADPAKGEPSWKRRITTAAINGRRVNEVVYRVVERHPEYLVLVKPDEGTRESAREADERTS